MASGSKNLELSNQVFLNQHSGTISGEIDSRDIDKFKFQKSGQISGIMTNFTNLLQESTVDGYRTNHSFLNKTQSSPFSGIFKSPTALRGMDNSMASQKFDSKEIESDRYTSMMQTKNKSSFNFSPKKMRDDFMDMHKNSSSRKVIL